MQTIPVVPEEPDVDIEMDADNNNTSITGEALISFRTEGMTVDMLEEINTTRSDTVQKMISTHFEIDVF